MLCSWVFLPNWTDSWSECSMQVMSIWSWTRISNPIICQESNFNKRDDPCPPTLHQCGKKSQVNKHNNCRHRVIEVLVNCVLLPKWTDSWGECIMQVMSVSNPNLKPKNLSFKLFNKRTDPCVSTLHQYGKKRHNSRRHELVGRNMTTELEMSLPTSLIDATHDNDNKPPRYTLVAIFWQVFPSCWYPSVHATTNPADLRSHFDCSKHLPKTQEPVSFTKLLSLHWKM